MSTKRRIRIGILITVVVVSLVIFIISLVPTSIGPCVKYECDVKFNLYTTIDIKKQGENFAKISGEKVFLKGYNDPLTMYDLDGEKIGYADDTYHLISQDSHSTIVKGSVTAEMVGKVKLLGEAYDIYDRSGTKVAYADFNVFNTKGTIKNLDGDVIADYSSIYFFKDYTVRIKDNCPLDENTVMMIFASYYSDQQEDKK